MALISAIKDIFKIADNQSADRKAKRTEEAGLSRPLSEADFAPDFYLSTQPFEPSDKKYAAALANLNGISGPSY